MGVKWYLIVVGIGVFMLPITNRKGYYSSHLRMRSGGRGLLSENPHELAGQLHDPKRLQIVSRKD